MWASSRWGPKSGLPLSCHTPRWFTHPKAGSKSPSPVQPDSAEVRMELWLEGKSTVAEPRVWIRLSNCWSTQIPPPESEMSPGESQCNPSKQHLVKVNTSGAYYWATRVLLLFWIAKFLPRYELPYGAWSFLLLWNILTPQTAEDNIYFSIKANRGNQDRTGLYGNNTCGQREIICFATVQVMNLGFWDSNTVSHFIPTIMGGRRWEADGPKTLEWWKRPVRVFFSEMFPWALLFFSFERGKQWEHVFISL